MNLKFNFVFCYSQPGYYNPLDFFCETVSLKSPGRAESADCFLHILNSLSLLEKCRMTIRAFGEMRGRKSALREMPNENKPIRRIWRTS